MIKKMMLSPWAAMLTLLLIICIRIIDPSFIESVRLRYFDTLITTRHPTENNIVTANISEASIDKYGQWPFSRDIYANIITQLYEHGAGLVVFNVLMPEADRQGGDVALANTLSKFPVILPSIPADLNKNIPRKAGSAVMGSDFLDRIVQYPGLIANIQLLEDAAAGVGTVNTLPEIDGVNRRVPLVASINGALFPSISLETLRVAAGDSTFQVKLNELGIEKMRIPQFGPIATDSLGRVWIDWSQKSKSISIEKIPIDLNGAIVIVGPTAAGIGNPVPSSIGAVFPHEVQAAVVGTMFNKVVIQRPDYADGLEIVSMLIIGVLLLLLTRWLYTGLISIVIFSVAVVVGSQYAYSSYLFLFDATALVAVIVLVSLHAYGVKFLNEFFQKQQIKKQFGSYVSPVMVERLQKNPELIKLGGERKELSIVMTDLRGFTTLGESYGDDVEGLTAIMNDYMTAISEPVLKNDGCIIKFIGDASLHVHNAPLDDINHAKNAVKTALEMIASVDGFNETLVAQGKPIVGMGAGVNTGQTLIGNIGSKTRFGYDVLGDSVSTAARLEGQTKSYGVLIIIGPETAELVKDTCFVIKLDNIAVKGKTIGLDIYTVLQPDKYNRLEYANARTLHNKMLKHYKKQEWAYATTYCMELSGSFDGTLDYYYDMMRKRIHEYMNDASFPKSWHGTFKATSK